MATSARAREDGPSRRRARRRQGARRGGGSDLGARILAALPAIAFAIFIVVSGGWIFALGLIVLGLVCLHELYAMVDEVGPVRLAGFLGLIGLIVAATVGGPAHVLIAAVAIFPILFLLAALSPRQEHPTLGMAVTLLGLWWVGLALAHAVLLRELPHGEGIIVGILVATFVGDTGAYLGGRMLGRTPMAPRISPNKTLEGLAVGMTMSVIGFWAAGLYMDWLTHGQALILGAGVALLAPVGDLFESYLKRDVGVKDTGRIFGAHGGALDRLDAVFFTAVAGYYIWAAMV
jgi:phosphatidate cytidylyltransferase